MARLVIGNKNNIDQPFPDIERPSIFVLFAEEQLQLTLRNALKFLLKVTFPLPLSLYITFLLFTCLFQFIGDRFPHFFSHLKLHSDELSLLLDLCIQWSYLHRWNASFTEHFFSVQRYNLTAGTLIRKDIFNSLIITTFVPYLVNKLDIYIETIQNRQLTNERFGQSLYKLSNVEASFLQYYPMVKQFHLMLRIFFWVSYSVGNQHSPSFPFWLFGKLRLGYVNKQILQQRNTLTWSHSVSGRLTKLFDVTLKSGAFLVQFLEYWYSQADVRQLIISVNQSPIPPSPTKKVK